MIFPMPNLHSGVAMFEDDAAVSGFWWLLVPLALLRGPVMV